MLCFLQTAQADEQTGLDDDGFDPELAEEAAATTSAVEEAVAARQQMESWCQEGYYFQMLRNKKRKEDCRAFQRRDHHLMCPGCETIVSTDVSTLEVRINDEDGAYTAHVRFQLDDMYMHIIIRRIIRTCMHICIYF